MIAAAQIEISCVSIRYYDIAAYVDGTIEIPQDIRQVLTEQEFARAHRHVFRRGRSVTLLSRYLLRQLLASELKVHPRLIHLELGEFGKPRLGGDHAGAVEFNVSHSGTIIAICTSYHAVGIDVEVCTPLEDIDTLCRHCLTPSEQMLVGNATSLMKLRTFLEIWTRKEAILKANGYGLSISPKSISVIDAQRSEYRWLVQNIPSPPGYIAAVARANE
ncbi:4'-phosphopantetheinyl transferase superfamily protein (plasmid) [Agrobacterium tumefaciens]|uniref:4'-phosphopantetheinyl transferase family protein n=1 Tax=Agrobacterium tumefaciens TaxID=358 RepID=UPI0015730F47|nr:4'-phosphopantetheinyl transferase superfamily protein [Agrobacterium tumefaciens]NSZ87695.1 4'-phosphopantetheinyl transferase superfamily protein [Agrobacterium tumefaciens]WCA72896.1 4'-phosphopantetheinyl transferase superfamily protein [Agrobacterium tumefaciens]